MLKGHIAVRTIVFYDLISGVTSFGFDWAELVEPGRVSGVG